MKRNTGTIRAVLDETTYYSYQKFCKILAFCKSSKSWNNSSSKAIEHCPMSLCFDTGLLHKNKSACLTAEYLPSTDCKICLHSAVLLERVLPSSGTSQKLEARLGNRLFTVAFSLLRKSLYCSLEEAE